MPAPNVIVATGLGRNIGKERADLYRSRAVSGAIDRVGDIVGASILQYATIKDREDVQKMALLKDIISTYGDQAGQPAMHEYDELLQKKGIGGLPKDSVSGDILPPPKTTDQLVDAQIKNDPQAIEDLAFKKTQGVSKYQLAMKQHEAELAENRDAVNKRYKEAMAEAAMIRAHRTGLKSLVANQPSGLAMGADGSLVSLQPGAKPPPGYVPISAGVADRQFKKKDLENKTELNDANLKLRDADLKLRDGKLLNNLQFGPESSYLKYFKLKAEGKTDKKFDERMEPIIRKVFADGGYPMPPADVPWYKFAPLREAMSRFKLWKDQVGPEKFAAIEKEVESRQGAAPDQAPVSPPATRTLKSGKVLEEEIP